MDPKAASALIQSGQLMGNVEGLKTVAEMTGIDLGEIVGEDKQLYLGNNKIKLYDPTGTLITEVYLATHTLEKLKPKSIITLGLKKKLEEMIEKKGVLSEQPEAGEGWGWMPQEESIKKEPTPHSATFQDWTQFKAVYDSTPMHDLLCEMYGFAEHDVTPDKILKLIKGGLVEAKMANVVGASDEIPASIPNEAEAILEANKLYAVLASYVEKGSLSFLDANHDGWKIIGKWAKDAFKASVEEGGQPATEDGAETYPHPQMDQPPVKLTLATAVFQPVQGTSAGSKYFVVSRSLNAGEINVAARLMGGSLSVRIEGSALQDAKPVLEALGIAVHDHHASVHVGADGDAAALATVGAICGALSTVTDMTTTNFNWAKSIQDKGA